MAIPGLKPQYEVRGKVRIGEKKQGSSFPSSVDHFLSEDPELTALFGAKPKRIRIRFPFELAEDCFSTGLEWWKGKLLACYTKGDGNAYRIDGRKMGQTLVSYIDPDDERRGAKIGAQKDRQPIACRFRECPHFGSNAGNKECRPMGRLQFFLDGGRTDELLQLDTKAWNSIEKITAGLTDALTRGRDLRGRVFELSVEMQQKGTSKFPVLSLEEVDVPINTEADVEKVETVTLIERERAAGTDDRRILAAVLDVARPGWRDEPRYIQRIQEVGPTSALDTMLERFVKGAE